MDWLLPVLLLFLILIQLSVSIESVPSSWEPVGALLEKGIVEKVFPGAVAAVFDVEDFLFLGSFGNFTCKLESLLVFLFFLDGVPPPNNRDNPPMTLETIFDLGLYFFILFCYG